MSLGFWVVLTIAGILLLACAFNRYLPKWFCDKLGWHFVLGPKGFDGCSFTGKCSRCGKAVLQDGQENWF